MKVWISTASTSTFAVINTLWAAIIQEDYLPEKIHLLANDYVVAKGFLKNAELGCKLICQEYGIKTTVKTHEFRETDFSSLAQLLGAIVGAEKQIGNEVAIDITPGRKFMSAFSMYMGVGRAIEQQADRIYYHHLLDFAFKDFPYPLIPANIRRLYDIKKETLEVFG